MSDSGGSNHESPLLPQLESAGGIVGDYHGRRLVRHFGEPEAEYRAATNGMALFDRSHRARLTVSGRAPGQMLNGMLTGRMPAEPVDVGDSVREGLATYHAVLTPAFPQGTSWGFPVGAAPPCALPRHDWFSPGDFLEKPIFPRCNPAFPW